MKIRKLTALLLVLAMMFALSACKVVDKTGPESQAPVESADPSENPSAEPSEAPEESSEPSEEPAELSAVRLAVLSGPTGIGAAKLLSDIDAGQTENDYEYVIEADNSALVAGLSNGELDIVTMASNMAVNLYNKTDGEVRIIALGTLGVLHILEGGGNTTINSVADLAGKTIWSAGQGANPEFILRHLLEQNELVPGEDVEIVFADATEITAKLLSGEIECAMLPVPAATAAIIRSEGSVRGAIDVTEAWDDLDSGSRLVMTAVVARTAFIEEHSEAVNAFLAEYEASIDYVVNHVDEAAELIAGYGITPSAGIARQAIPQCHLTYIAGRDMVGAISNYFQVLWSIDPTSIGGYLPDDAIYYVP